MKSLLNIRMFKFILIIGFFIITKAYAQIPALEWANRIGGSDPSADGAGISIATDLNGNVFTGGTFTGTVDFDPGVGTFEITSSFEQDGFVVKLDADGDFQWAQNMGGLVQSIAVDASGNVYATGWFTDDQLFGSFTLTNQGHSDIFIAKLDPDGNFEWINGIGGAEYDYGTSFSIDVGGSIYVAGAYMEDVTFGSTTLSSVDDTQDIFVARLDANGNFIWAQSIGDNDLDEVTSIRAHSGNVYLTGNFYGTVDFNPGSGSSPLISNGDSDIFICALDDEGDFLWAKQLGGPARDSGTSITTDGSGNFIISGDFYEGTVDFDPGTGVLDVFELTATGNPGDPFVLKLDNAGDFVWAVNFTGQDADSNGEAIVTTNTSGDVYITGYMAGTLDFDPDPVDAYFLSIPGSMYVVKLSSTGDFVWAQNYGGDSSLNSAYSITTDDSGNVYVTGEFHDSGQNPVDFDLSGCIYELTPNSHDIFIQKIGTNPGCFRVELHPESVSTTPGTTVTFEVEASGTTNITFQWQIYNPGTGNYDDLTNTGAYSGTTTSLLSVNTTGSAGEGDYRCKISGDLASDIFSNDASLSFIGDLLSLSSNHLKQIPITSGAVSSIVAGDVYSVLRGNFNLIGPYEGSGVVIDAVTGVRDSSYPIFHGDMGDVIPDGNGGWYVAGYSDISDVLTGTPVHIKPDKTIDENWLPRANGSVANLALEGNTLYIVGTFTQIAGQPRNNFAAFDITTGALLPWNPGSAGNNINFTDKLTASGGIVYVGGQFTSIGGLARKNLAAIDGATGVVTAWNPTVDGINSQVKDIIVSGGLVYVSGFFTSAGGFSRRSLAALDIITGAATSWNPNPTGIGIGSNSVVEVMLINGSTMYIGGTFTAVGGTSREYLAAINITTGTLTSWDPHFDDSRVYTLQRIGTTLYVGGTFSTINGLTHENLVAVSTVDGSLLSWSPEPHQYVLNMALSGTDLFLSSGNFLLDHLDANDFAVLNNSTSEILLTDLDIGAGSLTYAVTSGNTLYISGTFTQVNGQSRQKLAAIDIPSGTVLPWAPTTNGNVTAMAVHNSTVYLGGDFSVVNSTTRDLLAAVDATTGSLLALSYVFGGGEIHSLSATNTLLYIAGDFSEINGDSRSNLAAVNIGTGNTLTWNPAGINLDGGIDKIEANANWVAVMNSSHRVNVFHRGSDDPSFEPAEDLSDFTLSEDLLILGTHLIDPYGVNGLAAFDLSTNSDLNWQPDVSSDSDGAPAIYSVAFTNDKIFVGGAFRKMGFEARENFGAYAVAVPTSLITITNQPANFSGCAGVIATFTASATGTSNITYQWQLRGTDFTFSDVVDGGAYSGATTPTLSVDSGVGTVSLAYRCLIKGDLATPSLTNTAALMLLFPPLAPSATGTTVCTLETATLTATGALNDQYRWYTTATGGTPLAGEINSTFTTPSLSTTTSYYVAINNGTCEGARTLVTATITPPPAPPAITPASQCGAGIVTLNASGGTNGQYRWYATTTGITALTGEINSTFTTPSLSTTTSYYVAINNGICEGTRASVTATISTLPIAPTASPASRCGTGTMTLTASGGSNGQYRWYAVASGGTAITGQVNNTFTTPELSSSTPYYVSINNGTCESTRVIVIATVQTCATNQPPVIAPRTVETTVEGRVSVSLTDLISDPDNNLDLTTLKIIVQPASGALASVDASHNLILDYKGISFSGTEKLTIEVCDLLGACVQKEITIDVVGDVDVYNGMSPNGDGRNEIFFIQYIDTIEETKKNHVFIYNRWGDLVFDVADYDNKNNVFLGLNNNGNEIPSGTYFYKIEFVSGKETMSGYLDIRR